MTVLTGNDAGISSPGSRRRSRQFASAVDWAGAALVVAAVAGVIGWYGVDKAARYVGLPSSRRVRMIETFQWLGAISFALPLFAAALALSAGAAWLIRGRLRHGKGVTAGIAVGERGVRLVHGLVAGGYVPGLFVVAGAGAADQLVGGTGKLSTAVGSAIALMVFVGVWIGLCRRFARSWRPQLGSAAAVIAAVGALLSAGAFTRVQDSSNLALVDPSQSPISVGFHVVIAKSVPGVEFFVPSCIDSNPNDCVAVGVGSGYDSNPWKGWALLGTSTDGGATWALQAIPNASYGRATCSVDSCSVGLFFSRAARQEVTVAFGPANQPSISRQALPTGLDVVGNPICTARHCVGFAMPRNGLSYDAVYGDNRGVTWSTAALPAAPLLDRRVPKPGIYGPWCTTSMDCHGAYLETGPCPQSATALCSQITILLTSDGGRSWSEQPKPLNDPPLDPPNLGTGYGLNCTSTGICTTISAKGTVYLSRDWGATWRGPLHPPTGAVDVVCWTSTSCITSGGRFATADAGQTWTPQTTTGPLLARRIVSWCSTSGSCIGWGIDSKGTNVIVTRDATTSTWKVHPIPQPELQPERRS